MPTLPTNFNFGRSTENENLLLTRQLSETYTAIALVVNTKMSRYITDVDPPNTVTANNFNKNLSIGDIWINSTANNAWIMTSRTTDLLVTWKQIT